VAVRIRMKKFGRRHRPFFRVCVMDQRTPRDGRVLEELGTYDPMLGDVDARAVLNGERIQHWLGVGATPSDKVKVLIKKYGADGTHLDKQRVALDRLAESRRRQVVDVPQPTEAPEEPAAETPAEETPAEAPKPEAPVAEAPAPEAPAEEAPVAEAPVAEAPVAEAPAEEAPAEETKPEASSE